MSFLLIKRALRRRKPAICNRARGLYSRRGTTQAQSLSNRGMCKNLWITGGPPVDSGHYLWCAGAY
jgi:hypothetical protein